MSNYQEKFNELGIEIYNNLVIDQQSGCAINVQNIFENTDKKLSNLKLAREIEQILHNENCAIKNLYPLQIMYDQDDVKYAIRGSIDDQQIVHLIITKIVRSSKEEDCRCPITKNITLFIENELTMKFQYKTDIHESQLKQSLLEAINTMQYEYPNLN